jgi:D-alanyl-D-alanine carboxypeptidase
LDQWLKAALDYVPQWLSHQMRLSEQPGCALAVAANGTLVHESAWGHADLGAATKLTPRHGFRVASHSKTFTAVGVMKLREQGLLGLDDPVGRHVDGLHPAVSRVTLSQLLSHTAGLVCDGSNADQWQDRRPFLNEAELRADLADGPVVEPNTRFKYSNHGYGLLGLVIEAVTGEPWADWMAREVVAASGLKHTAPDMPVRGDADFASGHSSKVPLGHRVVIPATNPTHALAPATGFVSTAADLARLFASLAPDARKSVLSRESRREMTRRQWKDSYNSVERWYGLGTISGTLGAWEWFGHSGAFQGTMSRTVCLPASGLAVSLITNAVDGPAQAWLDGVLHILQAFQQHGAPSAATAAWAGRWWSLWGAFDFVPVGGKVLVANPALPNPVMDASQIVPGRRRSGTLTGEITLAGGFAQHGEPARIELDGRGRAKEAWIGGIRLLSEARASRELAGRYAAA